MYEYTHSEKRNYFRMQLNCPIYIATEDGTRRQTGVCVNLSVKGILIELDEEFPVGTSLIIKLEPGMEISPALSGMVEVLRVQRDEQSGKYLIGGLLETEVVV